MAVDADISVELLTTLATLSGLSPSAHFRGDDLDDTLDGEETSAWLDVSGNDYGLVTAGVDPTVVKDELRGHTVVRFDGTQSLVSSVALSNYLGSNGYGTVFVVAKPDAANAGPFWGQELPGRVHLTPCPT